MSSHRQHLTNPQVQLAWQRVGRTFTKLDLRKEIHHRAGLEWIMSKRVAGSLVWQKRQNGEVTYDSERGLWVKV
jgi:hypothetical protein